MIKRILRKARNAAKAATGLVLGQEGVGYGVSEYEDFGRLRAEAAALDQEEGNLASGSEMDAIAEGTEEIGAEELRVLLEIEDEADRPQLIDVREQGEWDGGHLPAALHIPIGSLQERLHQLDQDRAVVLYCASGVRAIDGSYVLKRAGFPRVRSLAGGIHAWRGADGPLIN